jgi:WD40 repeat protein
VAFSPDGRFLAGTSGERQWLWTPGTWDEHLSLARNEPDGWPGPVAFSADSRILALPKNRFAVQLVDAVTGEVLACLQTPQPTSLSSYAFSKDNRFLAVAAANAVQLWNLQQLRQRLDVLQLNW